MQQWQLQKRAKVDFRCPIITDEDKETERKHPVMIKIDSTKSGCGSARARFVMREAKQARDIPELRDYITDVAKEVNEYAAKGSIVVEGSQGTCMSLALSPDYPYVTSDNCTTASFVDDIGLSWKLIDKVVMLVKCLPTRVGQGPLPYEMSWKEITDKGLQEYGVNTGRPRRKASAIELDKLRYVAMLNGPTEIALTFCDHYDPGIKDETQPSKITNKLRSLIKMIEHTTGAPVTLLDTGKWFDSIIDLSET
jgi:adenylosuccinate synthase